MTNDKLKSDTYRLFGTLERHFGQKAVLNVGLMGEYNDFTQAEFAPRIAYNYHLSPLHTIRFSASTATRIPTFGEENLDNKAVINGIVLDQFELATQDLDPERIRALDIGYLGESESGQVHWDVKLFHERVKDLISEVDVSFPVFADGETRDFLNSGFATIKGAEAQITFLLGKRSRLMLTHSELDIDGSDFVPRQNLSISGPRRSSSFFIAMRTGIGLLARYGIALAEISR
ncbi:MAG: TonB-dependent receptor [Gammaproteobacteria bacterium]|nr:TonB-dependent receptor [Gammaproteobacteria bacterium]